MGHADSHSQPAAVERTDATIAPDAFFERFVWPNRPAVIHGLAEPWGSAARWTPQALQEVLGDKPVRVTFSQGVYDFDRAVDNWHARENDTVMPFSELARRIEGRREGDPCLYLHQTSIPERFPELNSRIGVPALVPDGALMMSNLWFGSAGNISSLHFDQPNNFLNQLYGRKRVILYDPFQLTYLYPSKSIPHFSQVDLERPDYERFPEFRKARCLEVVLEAGDSLYLPPFWWHQVYSDTASVSVNTFWKSYTHQLLAPAMVRVLPALYAHIPAKYAGYLAGRLPTVIDFAEYALAAGYELPAVVFACAALKQRLQSLQRQGPDGRADAEAPAKLPSFDEARALGASLVAAERISPQLGRAVEQWLQVGRRALALDAGQRGAAEDMRATVNGIAGFIAAHASR